MKETLCWWYKECFPSSVLIGEGVSEEVNVYDMSVYRVTARYCFRMALSGCLALSMDSFGAVLRKTLSLSEN